MSAAPCLVGVNDVRQTAMDRELSISMKGSSNNLATLRKILKGRYWIVDNEGNGNCFFAALKHNAEANGVPGMANMTVQELRNLIADELETASYIETWTSPSQKANFIAITRRQYAWVAGQEVHAAASRVMHCNITIVAADMGVQKVATSDSAQWEARLGYVSKNHYVSLMMVVPERGSGKVADFLD